MIPIDFPQKTKVLKKPSSMTSEECGSLSVFSDGKQLISCWKASWRERLSILFHGKVWLYVIAAKTQPPVALTGAKNVFNSEG